MATEDVTSLTDRMAKTSVDGSTELSFVGRGLKMDTESDAKEIADAISEFQDLRALRLEGNTLGVDAAKAISKALEKHKEFQRALWSDMFTGRLKTEIPPALRYLGGAIILSGAQLVELDLSDNAFGPTGIEGVTELLKSQACYTLKELRLNNNGLGTSGGKILAKCLCECYKSSSQAGKPLALHVFVSGRGRLENEGSIQLAEAFKLMGSLEEVSMPQNGINHPGITALSEAFKVNKNMRYINLNDNTFTEVGAKSMAKALPFMQELEYINFGDCLLRTGGGKSIANAIKDAHKKLKELHLSFNEINKTGAMVIAESVDNKDVLEKLELDGNMFGEEGVDLVRATLEANGKIDMLGSLSDDEGDEDDEEEDGEIVSDEEEEDDDDVAIVDDKTGEESEDPALQVTGTSLTPRQSPQKPVTVTDFLQFPSSSKLVNLGQDRAQKILQEIGEDGKDVDKATQIFMKVCSVVKQSDQKAVQAATECADAIYSQLFAQEDDNISSVITNSILVHMGLLKSEEKVKAPADLNGVLTVLEHVVKQDYFPKSSCLTLQFFMSKPNKALDTCELTRHNLLQVLYRF